MPKTKSRSELAEALSSLVGPPLGGLLDRAFRKMELAEEEIAAAKVEYRNKEEGDSAKA